MLHLRFYDTSGEPAAALQARKIRVTGGVVWNYVEHGLIASYADGFWKHRSRSYSRLCVEGQCRLLFGITREPLLVSEPIGLFSMTGTTLQANGVAFAQYIEERDMWQGLMRPFWWQAMRIIGVTAFSALVDESSIALFNPWDPPQRHATSSPTRTVPAAADPQGAQACAAVIGNNSSPRI